MGFFLWLSDLHLDPLYGMHDASGHRNGNDCKLPGNETLLRYPLGRVGCDAPQSLLESALLDARSASLNSSNNSNSNSNGNGNGNDNKSYNNNNNNNNNSETSLLRFVLVTGDFSRHATETIRGVDPIAFTESVLSTCIQSIASVFPGTPIVPVLGNNDLVPDYYLDTTTTTVTAVAAEDVDDPILTNSTEEDVDADADDADADAVPYTDGQVPNALLTMVQNGLEESFLSETEAQTFARGGYFSRTVAISPSSSVLIVSLNTVIYSVKHEPSLDSSDTKHENEHEHEHDETDDPLGQFEWLESQLRDVAAATATASDGTDTNAATGTTTGTTSITGVYIAGHIPPSIGSYRHSQLWHEKYADRYVSILKAYHRLGIERDGTVAASASPPPILGNFFGHVHTEEFRLLTYSDDDDEDDDDDNGKDNGNGKDEEEDDNHGSSSSSSSSSRSPLVLPLHVASSLTPIYGSNPSYRIVEYDDDSGALLDYTTHYLEMGSFPVKTKNNNNNNNNNNNENDNDNNENENENETAEAAATAWQTLPGFAQAYGVPDLSSDSLERVLERFEEELEATTTTATTTTTTNGADANINAGSENPGLWDTFWKRQSVCSSAPDDADDRRKERKDAMIDWLCTLEATSSDSYSRCLEERTAASNAAAIRESSPSGGAVLALIAGTGLGMALVLVVALSPAIRKGNQRIGRRPRRRQRRQQQNRYHQPPSQGDGTEIVEPERGATATSNSLNNAAGGHVDGEHNTGMDLPPEDEQYGEWT